MVVIRRTVFSDSIGVGVCVLGLLLAIWSRKVLGVEWSQDVELKQGHKLGACPRNAISTGFIEHDRPIMFYG